MCVEINCYLLAKYLFSHGAFYPSASEDSEEHSEEGTDYSDSEGEDEEATDEEAEGEEEDIDAARPIYQGASITVLESMLAICTLMSIERVSGKLMGRILKLIALHCPGACVLVYHFFCSKCIYPLEDKESVCDKCKKSGNPSFFIELPLLNQLQHLFRRRHFYEDLQYRFKEDRKRHRDNIEDIYDGQVYKGFMDNGGFLSDPKNISFMWYSDGIQVFKSSSFSIWPLCLVINELPYKKRTHPNNILLVGIWFGTSKPNPNLFLKPLRKTMSDFERHGHAFKLHDNSDVLVKGKILCGTCDMQAKCKFLHFKQFNGFYGCPNV
ncbi:hypothetical protein ONE63_000069 [Megalurothrips usitatus]|uniref:Uncharacterized protein n=1 Tax=Megalurothrips usitatus TaxID=439358 RepID=A0AAV7Y161_9NEOP|nr:hypothetical protein ONE63_000069 [Megalurothrips usitatus]